MSDRRVFAERNAQNPARLAERILVDTAPSMALITFCVTVGPLSSGCTRVVLFGTASVIDFRKSTR